MVDAFFRAARAGDFDRLVAVLHPDVVLRADFGARRPGASKVFRAVPLQDAQPYLPPPSGVAAVVAQQARIGALPGAELHAALVNGAAGVVITVKGRPFAIMGFTVVEGRIVEIDAIADPERVGRIAAAVLG